MGELIPAGVQALLQTKVTAYNLPDTCALYTKSETTGPRGQAVTRGSLVATLACRKGTAALVQQTLGGGQTTVQAPAFSLPWDCVITTRHLLVHDGTTYEVTEVRKRGQRRVAIQALVKALAVGQ